MSGAALTVRGLGKSFAGAGGAPLRAIEGVDLVAAPGEFVTIIGPSGCGKSTLFNLIAGLEEPDDGTIELAGQVGGSRLGRVAYMPQKDLLLPWRTTLDNVILPLEVRGVRHEEARRQALALFPQFGLAGFEGAYPQTLSGGMRSRAAFLRTVLAGGVLLLLDEPFGALDALTRSRMQEWLVGVWERERRTTLFITHDVDEAIFLADRLYVMTPRPGRIALTTTVDLPRPRTPELLTAPAFVALKARLLRALRDGAAPDDLAPDLVPTLDRTLAQSSGEPVIEGVRR
ncbi:MAG TPA: ABC transporter ATP-binding protein [Thermomicrobiales bacterium]|jgi:ABC-type nitrate/sulfonate/bicarbonate transport system ATPase subunit